MKNADMPVYPHADADGHTRLFGNGLTKSEHFAAMALQGLLSDSSMSDVLAKDLVSDSVQYADALLAALGEREI